MIKQVSIPEDLNTFISTAGETFLKPLYALSAAESLTDEVALQLAVKSGLIESVAKQFVKALHFSDFVVERNSEWNFTSQARGYLSEKLIAQGAFCTEMHALLFEIALTGDPRCGGDTIPRYLLTDVGKAYHKSPSSPTDGLKLYATAAKMELTGIQWLLGKLAIEQQQQGILPSNAIEPPFIRGMTLYRERRVNEAESFLKRVIRSNEIREEVAIACHLVGKIESRKPGMQTKAEELLRRSLEIGEKIHHVHHQAQALHSLGQLIGKDRSRTAEAEELLRRSLALDKTDHGKAQALHSLGQLIGKDRSRTAEAEELLRQSLEIGEKIHHEHHQAQALHSLGQLIGKDRDRVPEAEELLRRSLALREEQQDKPSEAQVLHTLGQLIGKDHKRVPEAENFLRRSLALREKQQDKYSEAQVLNTLGQLIGKDPKRGTEAEDILRRSLVLGEKIHHDHHQAQVLHPLGQLIGKDQNRVPEAELLLKRSLKILENLHDRNGQAQVLFSLGKIIWEINRPEAEQMLRRSIELNRKLKNGWALKMVQKELENRLKERS